MGNSFIHLFFLLLFFSCKNSYYSIAQSTPTTPTSVVTDKEALISFKANINTETHNTVLSTWDINLSPCNWTGIVCNPKQTRVVGLQLSGLALTGSISPSLGNLSFLRSIQLQNNQLTGNLPDQIGNLFRLRVLNLSSNSIQGVIPPNISHCKELRVLDLMHNQISGSIPGEIGNLRQLQIISLGGNHLSGAVPPSISNVSSLTVLRLSTNNLVGEIPSDFAKLRLLKVLDLTINKISGPVPSAIYNMSSLQTLALASNDLWGDLPGDVGVTLPNLLVFNFCFNKFTGRIPASLHNLTNIKVIRMANNSLHGTVPPGLGNLPFLEMYNIGHNKIVSSGENGLSFLESLTNSSRLNFLAFDYNLLEGVIPDSIGNLSRVLQKLYMGGNRFVGTIPPSLGQLSGLTLFDAHQNSISGQIPPEIGELENLQELKLARNRLSGGIPSSLGNLQKLNRIDLSENELVGSIPASFENFRSVLSIDLSKNKLNGSLPKQIFTLPSLAAFLNLSQNCLTGSLPEEIGVLENVVTIDISGNLLSGNIPKSIGKCKSLESLLLANNMLSGQIPDTIADLRGLETLDISSNHLSGQIPTDMQKLQALQVLNLSHNNLEGQVPCNGVFADPSKFHLEGNQNLASDLTYCRINSPRHKRRLTFIYIAIPSIAVLAIFFTAGVVFYIKRSRTTTKNPIPSFGQKQHQMITYEELRLATDNFRQENLIGSGSFGSVYKALLGGTPLAVKVMNMGITGYWKSFSAECAALKSVRHRNLVKLITVCSSIDSKNMEFLALVFEFMGNGSLEDWITRKRRNCNGEGMKVLDRLNVAIDVASALSYLHHECETPIIHCDLKPGNVLLDMDMTAKVGDFGLARSLIGRDDEHQPSISSTHLLKGSIGYIPPEYGLGEKPSTAGDVYSYGILLLELFTGKSPTDGIFKGELSLRDWVKMGFPDKINELLDTDLLQLENSHCQDGKCASSEIQGNCLISIVEIGLSCVLDSPAGRITIRDALHKLKSVKDKLLKASP
ncbi:probable LRR receptor-like serine/threonine-protein kinase At3g47570 isoform X2 [Ipomoea triloba]|uniref:probable LRR receptor-like serine/threonine-protein kinase At3g47570 isoform X2 n=1 Tax=Ipomoea triloba TaxID=35885 RepID=UPI00125E270B|nr:probable LRR receptor-like serine/threonine-protein kinase At3g47570 isoform X2 [Ipomoea triloba]